MHGVPKKIKMYTSSSCSSCSSSSSSPPPPPPLPPPSSVFLALPLGCTSFGEVFCLSNHFISSKDRGSHIPSSWMVHAGYIWVVSERVLGNGVRTHVNSKGKISTGDSDEGRTGDAVSRRTALVGWLVGWLVGCLTSQQQASVSQGRICSDNFTCCHTEIEVADPTFYLTQSQYTDTGPTSPSADPITPGAWQGSHWSANV